MRPGCLLKLPLAPGRFKLNFRWVIFKLILIINGWGISCEIALRWMSLNLNDGKSTVVQVMAWCRRATSHYLSQCWATSMSPYGITRPQCVNLFKSMFLVLKLGYYLRNWQYHTGCTARVFRELGFQLPCSNISAVLTHWGRATHICVGDLFYHDMQISWPDSGSPPIRLSDS